MEGLLGDCEMLQEGGDGEVEGELAVDLVSFVDPTVEAAGVGIEDAASQLRIPDYTRSVIPVIPVHLLWVFSYDF